jgi:hypothetical protein
MFGDRRAAVLQASANELTVAAPGSDASGAQLTVPVQVTTAGAASTPVTFILTRSSAGYFSPRFYPLPFTDHPNHEHVFVATDLGPAFLLTGKGSTERAMAAAEALNTLFGAAEAGKRVSVEAREKPEACVAETGAASCLATATAEDTAAYNESWSTAKGARASSRMLTAHWTALVEDYLALFVYKQRPFRMLESSSRGKILLELYGESVRRSGAGGGVPTGLVSPLPMRLAGELRDMAMVLPGEAQAKGAAAIAGLWAGTVDEPAGPRKVRVQIRLQGSRLSGTLTTTMGPLDMDTPIEQLSYEKGKIRFVSRMAGQTYDFKGALLEGQLAGTFHPENGTETLGRFTLSFVE